MNSYIETQNLVLLQNPDVRIEPASKCWRRTHAHCKPGPMRGTICKWKQAESYASTWLLLHEIGHVRTHKSGMTRAESETAAIRWTIETLKTLGLPVKRKQLRAYKDYVRQCYGRGMRRGLRRRIKSKLLM